MAAGLMDGEEGSNDMGWWWWFYYCRPNLGPWVDLFSLKGACDSCAADRCGKIHSEGRLLASVMGLVCCLSH